MQWRPATELALPVEWSFIVSFNGGFSTQRIQADWRDGEASLRFLAAVGILVWDTVVAPLVVHSTRLEVCTSVALGTEYLPFDLVPEASQGRVFGSPCDPGAVPLWVTHTGGLDRWARRPIYFPGSPAAWVDDGRLVGDGVGKHLTYSRSMMCGMAQSSLPGQMQLIRYHPGTGDSFPDAPKVPSYEEVNFCRVMTHCDRPPEGAV